MKLDILLYVRVKGPPIFSDSSLSGKNQAMKQVYDSKKHHRRSIRLKEYDYSRQGAYFVTVCVKNKENLLGKIVDGEMFLSEIGKIIEKCWNEIPIHYPCVQLDKYIIMPNHIHGIIIIIDDVGAGLKPAPTKG